MYSSRPCSCFRRIETAKTRSGTAGTKGIATGGKAAKGAVGQTRFLPCILQTLDPIAPIRVKLDHSIWKGLFGPHMPRIFSGTPGRDLYTLTFV